MIELAVALACLSLVIASAAALCASVARGTRQVREEAAAVGIARGLIAEVKARKAPGEATTRSLEVSAISAAPLREASAEAVFEPWAPGIAKASVRLSWTGCRGAARQIELTSLVETGGDR